MGALEFLPARYEGITPEDDLIVGELYELARQIQHAREGFSVDLNANPKLGDLMAVGMSAGGMHPKAIVAINWNTSEVKSGQFLLPGDFKQYILKFKDSDIWPTAEVELAYYRMAQKSGITMENCRLLQLEGIHHFLTERFDRKNGQKLHTATLQALNGPTTSYGQIISVCRKMNLPYPDMEQIFRRAVFNYFACVCDDHDKNFSFVMTPDGIWRLSPAYDVTFTENLKNKFIADRHAMDLLGENRKVTYKELMTFAELGDIRDAASIIAQIADAVHSFQTVAGELGIDGAVSSLISEHIRNHIPQLH